ncbi:hypothetical protein FG05_35285 [Fusarium graminearum]|nr:hypothetical protein FG05_35285 [Fusarium graminearum]
MVQSGP